MEQGCVRGKKPCTGKEGWFGCRPATHKRCRSCCCQCWPGQGCAHCGAAHTAGRGATKDGAQHTAAILRPGSSRGSMRSKGWGRVGGEAATQHPALPDAVIHGIPDAIPCTHHRGTTPRGQRGEIPHPVTLHTHTHTTKQQTCAKTSLEPRGLHWCGGRGLGASRGRQRRPTAIRTHTSPPSPTAIRTHTSPPSPTAIRTHTSPPSATVAPSSHHTDGHAPTVAVSVVRVGHTGRQVTGVPKPVPVRVGLHEEAGRDGRVRW